MYNVGYEYRKPLARPPVVVYASISYPVRLTLLNMRIVLPPFDKCNGHISTYGSPGHAVKGAPRETPSSKGEAVSLSRH